MAKEAYYFPHDCNSIQDPKMMTLFYECGLMGVAMFWIIIEILHQQDNGKITEVEFKSYLKFYYKMDQFRGDNDINKIEQVLNTCGLLLNKDGFVWSDRVIRNKELRHEIREKRSFAGKKSAESRIKSTCVEHVLNKGQQGKEKKVKEIDVLFRAPTIEEVGAYKEERGSVVDTQAFIDFYASKGWMVGKNKMKDWKAAFRNAEGWDRWKGVGNVTKHMLT